MAKVKAITRQGTHHPLSDLLRQLNPVLRGWTNYFRHAAASATFSYLQEIHLATGDQLDASQVPPDVLEEAAAPPPQRGLVARTRRQATVRHPNRPHHPLPLPRSGHPHTLERENNRHGLTTRHELAESRMRWKPHVRFGERAGETDQPKG